MVDDVCVEAMMGAPLMVTDAPVRFWPVTKKVAPPAAGPCKLALKITGDGLRSIVAATPLPFVTVTMELQVAPAGITNVSVSADWLAIVVAMPPTSSVTLP